MKCLTTLVLVHSQAFIPNSFSLSIFCLFLDTTNISFFLFLNFETNAFAQ